MKKRKKNNRLSFLTAIVCLLLFAGVLFLGMKNYEPEKSENPVQGVNSESSLKGYLGKGYAYAGSQEDASTGEESYLRYFSEKTQTQVGKELGISQVQVSRMEKKILKNLREKL